MEEHSLFCFKLLNPLRFRNNQFLSNITQIKNTGNMLKIFEWTRLYYSGSMNTDAYACLSFAKQRMAAASML